MEPTTKRQGSAIQELEQQVKAQNKHHIACVWGIEKFFDPKACHKFFIKNFGPQPTLTHLLKYKNKSFFLVKFSEPIVIEDFNKSHSTNKRVKVKAPQEGMQYDQSEFITVEECTKRMQRREVKATKQDWQKIRSTKIEDIVSPLHSLPYEQQLQSKQKQLTRVLQNYNNQFFKDAEVLRRLKDNIEVKPLTLQQFIPCSMKREGYRSKSQFTIGFDIDSNIAIGFNKGSYFNNTMTIQSPKNVGIISKNTKFVVALLEHFIKSQGEELRPFDRVKQVGFWRYLIVRESERTGQTLVMVVCKTKEVEEALLVKVKEELVEYMKKSLVSLTGLCWLDYDGQSDSVPSDKPTLLYGVPYYKQRIFDRQFQVSPGAFLQIHIEMCELLYTKIIQSVKMCDVVLDLGCGIGTIGISIQDKLPNVKVIGVQINPEAVEDAKKNSENYEVQLGRAQDNIKGICEKYRGNRIVAVLDPPRAGFNKEVMQALRRCRGLDNIIYVACNAGAIQDNLLQLTLPMTDKRRAPQFVVTSMKGFDLFPQTAHYEALYILKRIGSEE